MTEVQAFQNKALFASAGTGKTFRLTDRYIYTLHHSKEPKKIIAPNLYSSCRWGVF